MSLWLCLRFHQLPLQCLRRSELYPAAVVYRQRLLRINDCAAAAGIKEGMNIATARALAEPDTLRLLERDKAAEQQHLQSLCCWAYNITPAVSAWRDNCLQLEIGSSLKLHQGLKSLLQKIDRELTERSYHYHRGLAETPMAAWLLSFADDETHHAYLPLEQRLASLPLHLLDDFPRAVSSLEKTGCLTMGDILALPQAALQRRCGTEFVLTIQRMLGQRPEPQTEFTPPAHFSDSYCFGYEVKGSEELLPAIEKLLKSLCCFLRSTQLSTEHIVWQLFGINRQAGEISVRSTSAGSDWQRWQQLTLIHLERLELAISAESLSLICSELQSHTPPPTDLFAMPGQRQPLHQLIDKLRNRLGLKAVQHISYRSEHLPEQVLLISDSPATVSSETAAACAQRPFWLLPQPQVLEHSNNQLRWHGRLSLLYGPERIEDNWWRQPVSRDYYIARGPDNCLLWVFHDRLNTAWYLHGLFA